MKFLTSPAASTLALLALGLSSELTQAVAASSRPKHSLKRRQPISTDASDLDGKTFDFVIAGGGLAGLALASRISEHENLTVAVIEAGGSGEDGEIDTRDVKDLIDIPGNSYLHGLTNTPYDWNYTTVAQKDAGGTTKEWPRGRVLGGSGAINGLFLCRGSTEEYDAWNELNSGGQEDWGWSELNKYMMKSENFTPPTADQISSSGGFIYNASAHGTTGPIQAGFSAYWFTGNTKWIPAWLSLGFNSIDGTTGDNHGAYITPSTLNPSNQTRSDSKAGYIDPIAPRSNLVILTGYQVTKINWNSTDSTTGAVASGVTFQASATDTPYTVNVAKEVLLSGGTIGSAQILQLSGVGPSATLQPLGINVVSDLPVGHNLQDHQSNSMYWSTPTGTLTWGNLTNTTLAATELAKYEAGDYTDSMWTYINEAIGYISLKDVMNSTAYSSFVANATDNLEANVDETADALGLSDAQKIGLTAMYNITNRYLTTNVGQMEVLLTELGYVGGTNTVGLQGAFQHPYTRGTVLINTTSAFDPPLIDPRYYSHSYDVAITRACHEWTRKLAAATPMNELMITEMNPGASVTGTALDTWFKKNVVTEYHILGTCSMLPKASGGVVDTTLTVYGTTNVRVVDSSIMPLQVSAHLMAPTYGVAEKAADMIKVKYQKVIEVASSSSQAASTASTASGSSSAASSAATAGLSGANAEGGATNLSTGAKGGIAAGAAVAAVAAIVAAVLLAKKRKARKAAAGDEKGWYSNPTENDAWNPPVALADRSVAASPVGGAFYSNVDGVNSASVLAPAGVAGMGSAMPGFSTTHRDSYNTLDLAQAEPMAAGYDSYYANGSGPGTPYSDIPNPMRR
ncbi:Glucose dehydrogenase/choline dehydrogenase/mandelonitrile lyase (GMC oxidoreductase family) [Phaffia rhodozyma]|uniref:Glucose dehydrogenase/choline dehydrogenase/mandelonitrile lyase (GMC oxidoreductase family) n=1 Tax=Phaffia rhodozyma TaxID=264483 RepID=A0A0F7SQV9_PHARH|nr:Glucose dehydrogenase/choline dehydrogenase/mandelonitrile lyase (GMC oxidoreductase family) [Phaffia rhodozyma]